VETAPVETAGVPVLPSPEADLYAHGTAIPLDPLVARQAAGLPWDEALSGAAGALAMEGKEPSMPVVRWAAVRAGYPYPIASVVLGRVGVGSEPEDLLEHVRPSLRPTDDLGLARARVGGDDVWVALVGRRIATLAPFPREIEPGGSIVLASDDPLDWTLVSPEGELRSGKTSSTLVLASAGEWWLEVRRPDGKVVASVPLYVGMPTPAAPLVEEGGAIAGPDEATEVLVRVVNDVRSAFAREPVRRDATLQTLADRPLEQVLEGTWVADQAEARLQAAGFVGGPVGQLVCDEESVFACVDGWLRRPRDRVTLLEPGFRVGGAAVEVRTDGVTAVLNLASE
jgi:hypothetical protein